MALSAMRSGVLKSFFLGILVLGGVGLILSDHGNFFHDGLNNTDVIVIDGHPIKSAEFDHIVRQNLQGKNISAEDAYKAGMIDRIAKNEIMMRLLNRATYDYGISANDATVAAELQRVLKPMTPPGGDMKETLKAVLQAQNMTEASLVQSLRGDIQTRILRDTIGGGINVPSSMTDAFYQWNMEERKISYVTIPETKAGIKDPTDSDLKSYYDMFQADYMIPESRDVTVAVLDLSPYTKNASISDEQVRKFYDDNAKNFAVEEAREIEQAVLKTEKEANDVLIAAKDANNLQAAVKKVTGKETAYTKPSFYEKSALPAALADPAFAVKEKSFAGPFKTALGYHVVHILGVTPAGTKKFDDVKSQIRKELSENASSDAAYEITTAIEDRLAGGEKPQDLAEEYKLKIISVKGLNAKSDAPELKDFANDKARILQAAFNPNQGESSLLSEISDQRMFTVYVDAVNAAKPKPLKDVRDEVLSKWRATETRKKLLVDAMKITSDIDAKKSSLSDIAKKYGAKVETGTVVRGSNPPAGISKQGVSLIMVADVAKAVAIPGDANVAIVKIESTILPSKKPTASELSNIEKNLALDIQEERFSAFIDHIQKDAKVRVNQELIDRLYGQTETE